MSKIIEAFKANTSKENALKVLAYVKKHPMTACFYPAEVTLAEQVAADYFTIEAAIARNSNSLGVA